MVSLLIDGTDVFTGDTLFKGSVGGVRAPGHTTYADLKASIMDTLLTLRARDPHPSRPHRARPRWPTSSSTTASCASGAGLDPEGDEAVHRARRAGHADPARATTTTAGTKPGCAGPTAPTTSFPARAWSGARAGNRDLVRLASGPSVAKDKIPTSRVGRTAKIGGLAAGQAIRQAGTRAANVARTKEGRQRGARKAPHRGGRADRRGAGHDEGRGHEGRPGDVLPRRRPRARGVPRGVPAQAGRAARRRADGHLQGHAQGHRGKSSTIPSTRSSTSSRRSRWPPPRSARSTGRG